jgi:hypothetical protein
VQIHSQNTGFCEGDRYAGATMADPRETARALLASRTLGA